MRFRFVIFILFLATVSTVGRAAAFDRRKNKQQVERTAPADARVVVSACMASGNLTVRSWDRNEVRALVTDGTQIDLTRVDRSNGKVASELKVSVRGARSCIPFGELQLDVPRGAHVKLESSNGAIDVTDVARVSADSQAGSIELYKIREAADVNTIGGSIEVRDSAGTFKLHSVGGSVEARNLSPAQATDIVDATTIGGEISLDRIRHQRVRVNSTSGQVEYSGPLSPGGRYSFQGISGQMLLVLPANSSFRLSGSLGSSGSLSNDFTRDGVANSHNNRGMTRRIDAVVGTGDAAIDISLFSGSVQIKKQ